jgi:hypothetical protein
MVIANDKIGRFPWLPLLSLFFFLLSGLFFPAFAVDFNAGWFYRQSGGDGLVTQDEFRQRYSLGVGPTWSYQPTHALSANAGISYTKSETGDEQGTNTRDEVSPYGSLTLLNDIFLAQLAGSTNLSSGESGSNPSRNSWEASLGSNWNVPYFPTLQFSYSERTESPDSAAFFSNDTDQKETNTSVSVSWDLVLAQLSYAYNKSETEDLVNNSIIENNSHFARLSTDGKFWGDRVSFNFAQQYSQSDQQVTVGSLEDSAVDFPVLGEPFSAVTPVDPPDLSQGDTLDVFLAPFPGELEFPPDQRIHFYVRADNPLEASLLRLGLDTLTDDSSAESLQWDLFKFISGTVDGQSSTLWELVEENIPTTYDPDDNIIGISIPDTGEQFMVVAVNRSAVTLTFTEVGIFRQFVEDTRAETTSYLTNFGLRYTISRSLQASFNLVYDHAESDSDDFNFGRDRWNGNGRLSWSPASYLTTSLGYNESRNDPQDGIEDINRNYSMIVSTTPLPLLNVSFGVTLSERFSDSFKIFTSNRYFLVARGPLYPDLTAAWNVAYTDSERSVTGENPIEESTLSTGLDLNARLYRSLFADFKTTYSQSEESDRDRLERADASFGLRYRPSELIAILGDYKTYFGDETPDDELRINLNLRLLQTYKTTLTLTALHSQRGTDANQALGLVGNWDISRNLQFQGRGNYRFDDINTYNFSLNLNFRL